MLSEGSRLLYESEDGYGWYVRLRKLDEKSHAVAAASALANRLLTIQLFFPFMTQEPRRALVALCDHEDRI